ncbi:MAG: hypothetical protein ACE5EK_09615 [Nitrospinales bacterium]
MLNQLIEAMAQAISEIKRWPEKTVQIFHHNDTDGLSSGAILKTAFERQGYEIRRFCLEKPYPAVLKKVFEQKGGLIVFTDFAGRIAPLISDLNKGENLVLILDHHKANPAKDPMVHNLDPELFGLKGDRDITASTTCYLFANTWDTANQDLAFVASIGAVGDQFLVEGRLFDQNRLVVLEAEKQGLMEIRTKSSGETYLFKTARGMMPGETLWTYLDTLGAAGYYQDGPEMGVRVCLEGFFSDADQMFEKLNAIQQNAFKEQINRLQQGKIHQTPRIQWLHAADRFSPMGVKMIGAFCDMYKDSTLFDPQKYIAGFMALPNEIPGFGPVTFNEVKISMRVSAGMQKEIRSGNAIGLDQFLPEATHRLGGFSDACHSLTAATTIPAGKEEKLIDEMECILSA